MGISWGGSPAARAAVRALIASHPKGRKPKTLPIPPRLRRKRIPESELGPEARAREAGNATERALSPKAIYRRNLEINRAHARAVSARFAAEPTTPPADVPRPWVRPPLK